MKTRVAVFFGGRSPEHDVSIITGLQALNALDQQKYSAFPVYVTTDGNWLVGDLLRDRGNYLPKDSTLEQLDSVTLDVCPNVNGTGRLLFRTKRSFLGTLKPIEFDVALLAFHGLFGEDGRVQGLFELANVPYTGMRLTASSVCMDKVATKRILAETGIQVLPSVVIRRPASGFFPSASDIERQLGNMSFPVIVKPVHLGSSIGVAMATTLEEVRATLPVIFRLDDEAVIEPFVQNLVEYNIAVRSDGDVIATSAIEQPKSTAALLDFKAKYMSAAGGKTGGKLPGTSSEGMLSLTRTINPPLSPEISARIREWARGCFSAVNGSGAPRIDFLSDAQTGELWLNEVNPCPGSMGYFLWEAAEKPVLFTDFLTSLMDEAFRLHRASQLPQDPTQAEARLFTHS
jgi:D-alanine-D-alanine ligase